MVEQVRLSAVWPMENWLGSSLNRIQGGTIVQESYSHASEQGPLPVSQLALNTKITVSSILNSGKQRVLHEPARVAEPGGHHRQVHEAGLQAREAPQERTGM